MDSGEDGGGAVSDGRLVIIDDMIGAPISLSGRPHECSSCGKLEPWSASWSWYGSYRDIDDGAPVLKFCSTACADKMPEVAASRAKAEASARGDKIAEEKAEIESEEIALRQQLKDLQGRKRKLKAPPK